MEDNIERQRVLIGSYKKRHYLAFEGGLAFTQKGGLTDPPPPLYTPMHKKL